MNETNDPSTAQAETKPEKAPYRAPEQLDLGEALAVTRGGTGGLRLDFPRFTHRH